MSFGWNCIWMKRHCSIPEVGLIIRLKFASSSGRLEASHKIGWSVDVWCPPAMRQWKVFPRFQCSITSFCFVTNIFVVFQRQIPIVIRVINQSEVGDIGRGARPSGRYWRLCDLGCKWISVGPVSFQCGWGLKSPRKFINKHLGLSCSCCRFFYIVIDLCCLMVLGDYPELVVDEAADKGYVCF